MSDSRPHILFINQHYWPDNAATALALNDLAEFAAKSNYSISVISSRYLYDHSGEKLPQFETKNGVRIFRVNQSNYGRFSHRGRLMDYFTFFWRALRLSISLKPDYLITLTTPPLLGTIGWVHKLFRTTRFIYWSMDLHPEAEIAAGLIKPKSSIASLFKRFHEKILASADAVVTLSSNMKKFVSDYAIPDSKVHLISIWSDENEITPEPKSNGIALLPAEIRDKFIVHYSGNLGLAHQFECLVQVMELAQIHSDIHFVFTGGGPQMPVLREKIELLQLKNVLFQPYVCRAELSISLSKADVQWFSLDPNFEGIAFPSKLIGYMASGRPILFLGANKADSAQEIENANCGFSFSISQPKAVLSTILSLKANPKLAEQLGTQARNYFEQELTKQVCCTKWMHLIDSLEP